MNVSVISIVFRATELITIIVCLILHFRTAEETGPFTIVLASGTFFGYTIILVGWFAMKNIGNPINKSINIGISLLGCVLFIASGVLILVEWNRNDVDRIKMCIPATDYRSRSQGFVQQIITSMTHAAADSVASELDKVGNKHFLYSSETHVMAVVKGILSIIGGILFILDIPLTNKLQDTFKATEAPARQQTETSLSEVHVSEKV